MFIFMGLIPQVHRGERGASRTGVADGHDVAAAGVVSLPGYRIRGADGGRKHPIYERIREEVRTDDFTRHQREPIRRFPRSRLERRP
jgi:hypothetical protein